MPSKPEQSIDSVIAAVNSSMRSCLKGNDRQVAISLQFAASAPSFGAGRERTAQFVEHFAREFSGDRIRDVDDPLELHALMISALSSFFLTTAFSAVACNAAEVTAINGFNITAILQKAGMR